MVYFDYVDNLQAFLSLIFIQIEGYIFTYVSGFKLQDGVEAFRVLRLLNYPGFLFREIGNSRYSTTTWSPLLIGFMVQLTVHVIAFLITILFYRERKIHFFLKQICTYGYYSIAPHGIVMMATLLNGQNKYILAMLCLIQSLFMRPFHIYLHFYHTEQERKLGNIDDEESNHEEEDKGDDEKFNGGNDTFGWEMFHAIFSTQNVGFLFGMLWAGTKWEFPKFIETISSYAENAISCATLFFLGVIFHYHPIKGCKYLKVITYLLIHFILIPFIAVLYCWAFHIDKSTARIIVVLFSLPIDNVGLEILNFDDPKSIKLNSTTYTIYFSQIIGFPLMMCWLAFINNVSIF